MEWRLRVAGIGACTKQCTLGATGGQHVNGDLPTGGTNSAGGALVREDITPIRVAGTIQDQVHDYIVQNFLFGEETDELQDDDSLLELGVLDETGVLELVLFLEETYGVTVNRDDLSPENFESVNSIASYVLSHM